jgi:hypothetical protein
MCSCVGPSSEAEQLAAASTAFEGTAIAEESDPPAPPCPAPPAPEGKPGCVRLLVWDAQGCAAAPGVSLEVDAREFTRQWIETGDDGVAELCDLTSGPYKLSTYDREIDLLVVAGEAASRVVNSASAWRTRFEVERVLAGDLADQVWVEYHLDDAACGLGARFTIGDRYRVLGHGHGEQMHTGLCDGTRQLMSAPGELEPGPAMVPPRSGCAGCAAGGDAGLAVVLALALALRPRAG